MTKRSSPGRRCTIGARLLALCTLAVLVAGVGMPSAAEPPSGSKGATLLTTTGAGTPVKAPAASNSLAPSIVLYDQTTNLSGTVTSQNFEASFDQYDNQAADDFLVTGAGWNITSVLVPGAYSATHGSPQSMNITFYQNAGGFPGAVICDYPTAAYVEAPVGTFTVALPVPCNIPGGTTAWMSARANLNFAGGGGQWFWATRTVLTGFPAVWQNPGDGFGTGCTTWGVRTTCIGATNPDPDMGFRLEGTLASCSVNSDCNDGNVCTDDVCNVGTGCVYTNNSAACNDGNACTTGDTCSGGVCAAGTPVVCNDGLFCTIDTCNPGTGACVYTTGGCNDGNSCTFDTCDEAADQCTYYQPPTVEFCNAGAISIPLVAGPASPYPAPIAVSGLPASSAVCTVKLRNITHTWSDDLDILLSGPGAGNAIVMSDVGGGVTISNVSLTLTDGAAAFMPTGAGLVSGTYKPTNYGAGDTFAAPAPAPVGGSALSGFGEGDQNGTWNLWVMDDFAADGGSIAGGWCVAFVRATCANDGECNDGNPCNGIEQCVSNRCESGAPIDCDDGLFCTLDSCDPATGLCNYEPNLCDDANACTDDSCDEIDGCVSTDNTSPCDDGDLCTTGDVCGGGVCAGTNACVQFCNVDPISIPVGGAATPYPSSIVVSGVDYPAIVASVDLNGFSHLFPDDLDILLAGPVSEFQNTILMSDAGGGTDAIGLNLKFSDGAATAIPDAGPLVSGTFQPADYAGGSDAFPAPAPSWSGLTALSTFNGNPNGTFSLFVFDEFTPDDGSIDSWCLNILTVGCTDDFECDDGNFCTVDACTGGVCENVYDASPCDDGNPCTSETCDPNNGCGYFPVVCDDGLSCTTDSCVDFVGCQFTPSAPATDVGSTLLFTASTELDWAAEPAGPFNVYRGSVSGSYDHTCFASSVAATNVSDAGVPAAGSLYYYLVSRDNACGESGLGSGTPGPRPNTSPCP